MVRPKSFSLRRIRGLIFLCLSGGGFALPASPEAVEYMFKVVDGAEKEGKSLAVLFLSYGMLFYLISICNLGIVM